MEIVVNGCYGGFGLSDDAFERLIQKGWKVTSFNDDGHYEDRSAQIAKFDDMIFGSYSFVGSDENFRTHPDLIAVIKEMGEAANGRFARLRIVEIPDDVEWEIEEYDGNEWVSEKHRTW